MVCLGLVIVFIVEVLQTHVQAVDIFDEDDKFSTIPLHTFKGLVRVHGGDALLSVVLETVENLKRKFILSLDLSLKCA